MDTKKEIILEDDRALLRPLQSDDFEHLKIFSIQEPELWDFSLSSASGEQNMKTYIEKAIQNREAGLEYPFIVFDKQAGSYAGCTRFYDIQPAHHSLQIGFTWYGKAFQRTGLNRHCKYLLLSYAFDQAGIERVEFRANLKNERSILAMQSIGCTKEGILRSHVVNAKGERRDSIVLSILQNEWQASVQQMLFQKVYGDLP